MGDENAALGGGDPKYVWIAHSVELCAVCGEEVDRRFAPGAAGDDRVVEAGVRQKADHGAIAIAVGAARGPASLSDQQERDASR